MTNKWIVKEINNEKVELLKEKFNLSLQSTGSQRRNTLCQKH